MKSDRVERAREARKRSEERKQAAAVAAMLGWPILAAVSDMVWATVATLVLMAVCWATA